MIDVLTAAPSSSGGRQCVGSANLGGDRYNKFWHVRMRVLIVLLSGKDEGPLILNHHRVKDSHGSEVAREA